MATKFKTEHSYNKINFDEVVDFLETNGTAEDKAEFKKNLYTNSNGETSEREHWLNAKKLFCKKFAPELIPVAKEKPPKKSDRIKNW